MVYRIFVEKKPGLDNEARELRKDARTFLGIKGLEKVRLLNRYDAEDMPEELFSLAVREVFSEPQLDDTTAELSAEGAAAVFAVEYLPGQFDQRADSAAQCIQFISRGERPLIRSAKVYILYGTLTEAEILEIKKYVINPVEAREASLGKPETLRRPCGPSMPFRRRSRRWKALRPWTGPGLKSSWRTTVWPWIPMISPSARTGSKRKAANPPSPRSGCWTPTGATTAAIPPS